MADNKKITIYDVAKKARVSRQTVSRVLNDRPDVSADTRERVKQVIRDLHYRPNAIARSLSSRRSRLLGVVTAGLRFIGPSRTLSGITSRAEEFGYGLLIKELSNFDVNDVQTLLQWFQSHQVEGIIWANPQVGENRDWMDAYLPKSDIPVLFLTMEQRNDAAIVSVDNYYGARLAVQHLIACGSRNIGHIAGPSDWWETQQRIAGWEDALGEVGVEHLPFMKVEGNWSSKSGKVAFEQLLGQYPHMDAVFVANDQMALGVLLLAADLGKKIPDDLMVVGFDGIAESEFFLPPLTTITQNQNELGRMAVSELVGFIEGAQAEHRHEFHFHHLVKPEIVVRRSTCRPK